MGQSLGSWGEEDDQGLTEHGQEHVHSAQEIWVQMQIPWSYPCSLAICPIPAP